MSAEMTIFPLEVMKTVNEDAMKQFGWSKLMQYQTLALAVEALIWKGCIC